MNVAQLKNILNNHYHDDDVIAYQLWSREDVQTRAEQLDIYCTEQQAYEILEKMNKYKDAEYGLCWDTIDHYLEELENNNDKD